MGNVNSESANNPEILKNPPSPSKSEIKPRYSLEENLIYLKSIFHENYGDIKIMKLKDDSSLELFALKVFRVNDAKTMKTIYREANYRREITLDTVVKIKDVRYDEANLVCSDHFKVLVLLEFFEVTLKSEIRRRKEKNIYFSDRDILNLIDCVLSALILFDQKNISHEDVSPNTIFLAHGNIFKLNDIAFLTEGLNAYKKFFIGAYDSSECYLSPELLNNWKHRCISPENYSKQKSDIFSLGMTVLEAANLHSVNECYDFDEFKVNFEKLELFLDEMAKNFNASLCELVKIMVDPDENRRPNYQHLYTLLAPILDQLKDSENPIEILPFNNEEKEEKVLKAHQPMIYDQNTINLHGRVIQILQDSEETHKKFSKDLENSRGALSEDDLKELIAKRDDFLSKSNYIKENLYKERNSKLLGEDENFFDSNKLYEVYLEEYEKLKAMKD